MPNSISDQKLNRQIDHLTQYLPTQDDLHGKRQGTSFYRHTNEKSFVEAHKIVFKQVKSLNHKFELTNTQKDKIKSANNELVHKVKTAFVNNDNPPANLDNFIHPKKRTG